MLLSLLKINEVESTEQIIKIKNTQKDNYASCKVCKEQKDCLAGTHSEDGTIQSLRKILEWRPVGLSLIHI